LPMIQNSRLCFTMKLLGAAARGDCDSQSAGAP
jgi:hypothetical protein